MYLLLVRLAAGIFLLWATVAVVAVIATFALTAHEDQLQARAPTAVVADATPAPATPEPPRPNGVPADATLITEDTVLGALSMPPPGSEEGAHLFFWLTCDDRLLTIATTEETIYATVDCAGYWLVHEVVRPYQGQPVRVDISVGPPGTLVMEASRAGAARFEVEGVWVQVR